MRCERDTLLYQDISLGTASSSRLERRVVYWGNTRVARLVLKLKKTLSIYSFLFIFFFFLLWKRIGYPILVFRWEGQRANFQRVSWYSKKRMNELLPTGWWWRESLRLPVRQCPTPHRHWRLHIIRRPRRENNDEINEKGEKGKGEITQATSWIWFPNLASLPRAANRAAFHVLFVSRTSSSSSLPPVLSIDVQATPHV